MPGLSFADYAKLSTQDRQNRTVLFIGNDDLSSNPDRIPYAGGPQSARALMQHVRRTLLTRTHDAHKLFFDLRSKHQSVTTSENDLKRVLKDRNAEAVQTLANPEVDPNLEQLKALSTVASAQAAIYKALPEDISNKQRIEIADQLTISALNDAAKISLSNSAEPAFAKKLRQLGADIDAIQQMPEHAQLKRGAVHLFANTQSLIEVDEFSQEIDPKLGSTISLAEEQDPETGKTLHADYIEATPQNRIDEAMALVQSTPSLITPPVAQTNNRFYTVMNTREEADMMEAIIKKMGTFEALPSNKQIHETFRTLQVQPKALQTDIVLATPIVGIEFGKGLEQTGQLKAATDLYASIADSSNIIITDSNQQIVSAFEEHANSLHRVKPVDRDGVVDLQILTSNGKPADSENPVTLDEITKKPGLIIIEGADSENPADRARARDAFVAHVTKGLIYEGSGHTEFSADLTLGLLSEYKLGRTQTRDGKELSMAEARGKALDTLAYLNPEHKQLLRIHEAKYRVNATIIDGAAKYANKDAVEAAFKSVNSRMPIMVADNPNSKIREQLVDLAKKAKRPIITVIASRDIHTQIRDNPFADNAKPSQSTTLLTKFNIEGATSQKASAVTWSNIKNGLILMDGFSPNGTNAKNNMIAKEGMAELAQHAIVFNDFKNDYHAAQLTKLLIGSNKLTHVFDADGQYVAPGAARRQTEPLAPDNQTLLRRNAAGFRELPTDSLKGQLILNNLGNISPREANALSTKFSTLGEILDSKDLANRDDLEARRHYKELINMLKPASRDSIYNLKDWEKAGARAEVQANVIDALGASYVPATDPKYPQSMRDGASRAQALVTMGHFDMTQKTAAIFGSGPQSRQDLHATDKNIIKAAVETYTNKGYAIAVDLEKGVSKEVLAAVVETPDAKVLISTRSSIQGIKDPEALKLIYDVVSNNKGMVATTAPLVADQSAEGAAPKFTTGARYAQSIVADVADQFVLTQAKRGDIENDLVRLATEQGKPVAVVSPNATRWEDPNRFRSTDYNANRALLAGAGVLDIKSEARAQIRGATAVTDFVEKSNIRSSGQNLLQILGRELPKTTAEYLAQINVKSFLELNESGADLNDRQMERLEAIHDDLKVIQAKQEHNKTPVIDMDKIRADENAQNALSNAAAKFTVTDVEEVRNEEGDIVDYKTVELPGTHKNIARAGYDLKDFVEIQTARASKTPEEFSKWSAERAHLSRMQAKLNQANELKGTHYLDNSDFFIERDGSRRSTEGTFQSEFVPSNDMISSGHIHRTFAFERAATAITTGASLVNFINEAAAGQVEPLARDQERASIDRDVTDRILASGQDKAASQEVTEEFADLQHSSTFEESVRALQEQWGGQAAGY